MKNLLTRLAAAAALALAFACGSDSDDTPAAPPQPAAVTGVGLDSLTLRMRDGESKTLTAQVMPSNAANKGVTWGSSDNDVATVAGSGLDATVTAHRAGTATIKVTTSDGNKTSECSVIVTDGAVAVAGVAMDRAALSLAPGSTDLLTARLWPSDATNQDITWASSNAACATVTKGAGTTAWVTAVAAGTATITATVADGGMTAACSVIVAPYTVTASSVSLDVTALSLLPTRRRSLTATVWPLNTTNLSVAWSTSNPAVATVSGTSTIGTLIAVGPGSATITVTTASGGLTATCAVTVEDRAATPLIPNPISVAGGYSHVLAIKEDGSLWTWGYNGNGQLGVGDLTRRLLPIQVGTDNNWVAVSAGWDHSIGLKSDGTIWTWGSNAQNQIGNAGPTNANQLTPIQVGTDTDWVAVKANFYSNVAVKSDGSLWVWGYPNLGTLGLGDTAARNVPTRSGTANDWGTVYACGYYHTLIIKKDGSLWSWGGNNYGQVGNGTTAHQYLPNRVGTANDWATVSCGTFWSAAVKTDGSAWTWGTNGQLQLGRDTPGDRETVPGQLGTLRDWVAAAGSTYYGALMRMDGSIWTWGYGNYGNIGNGSWDHQPTPVQAGPDRDWVAVTATHYAFIALKADGSLWTWGLNNQGGLGVGDTTNRNVPVRVADGFRLR